MGRFDKIPEDRKKRLDEMFEAFSIIGDDTYVYLCDMQYDYSRWSKVLINDFGLPGEYMYGAGTIWEEHIHPEDRKVFHEGIDEIFNGRCSGHDMQYRARRKNGEYDVCTCRGVVLRDKGGQPEYFGGAIRNHSQQSHVDRLTGLRNQYGFFEDIQSHIDNKTPIRVSLIGISKFYEINELYGYAIGNSILQMFGRYLMDHVGNRGGTYRMEGTKFAVITETQTYAGTVKTYEKLRAYFREGIGVGKEFITLELNAGTLDMDDFTTDYKTVYACLNFAYDDSKINKQGDIVEFSNSQIVDNRYFTAKLHTIRNSISSNFDGFFLLYQPVIDAKTEKLIGAEALLRWENDKYGVVPPDKFIPILEKDPLFPLLGEWILYTALTDAIKIQELLPDFVINVNLSYSQLERLDFTDSVWKIVNNIGFNPQKLCLEITERCRLLDVDLLKNIMAALHAGGIRIALDDFGTGFSSIGLLKSLPFDIIKIDKDFIQRIEDDEKESLLVKSFTDVAEIFGAVVCVEGIETSGARDILRKFNINSLQGYYYSKPISIKDMLKNVKNGSDCFAK